MTSNLTPSGGLFTHHFAEAAQQPTFNHPAAHPTSFALPGSSAPSPAELERTIATAWELLVERWDGLANELHGFDLSTLRERWLRPLFTLLDFELEYQRADLVLDDDLRFPIAYLGRPIGASDAASVPIHSVGVGVDLDTRPSQVRGGRGPKALAPHDMLQRYLNIAPQHKWALLTNGLSLRLLRDYHHTTTRGYVEFDLRGMFEQRDFAAFRALYRLAHASRFIPSPVEDGRGSAQARGGEGSPIEQFYQHALSTGVKVGEDLRKNVRQALETLGNGFLEASPGLLLRLQDQEAAPAFFADILTTVYRVLFLLFAEQRGMLPGRGSLYMDEFSLTALRTQAERPLGEDRHVDLWERLKTTFQMVEEGVPELGVFGYDGVLFDSTRTPILTPPADVPQCRNTALLRAIRYLTTVEQDGVLQRVSYADLSVEEIGSIYESLLDYAPRLTRHAETIEGRGVPAGTFYLDPRSSARKTTGSYYTHPALVDQLIGSALLPVLIDRLRQAAPAINLDHPDGLLEADRVAAQNALLNLRVCDPAAGSGAFLIAATNTLALHLARLRSGDLYPLEREVRRARRDVLAHCIYGVDLNPMAVELCKVSLWINAAVDDAPLSFLDHHIKCGNSLIGATPELWRGGLPDDAFAAITADEAARARSSRERNRQARSGQLSLWRVTTFDTVDDWQRYVELTSLAEDAPKMAEVRYHAYVTGDEYQRRRLPADLWTAAFMWPLRADWPEPPTSETIAQAEADPASVSPELQARASELAERYRFFHWPLEFPEVFTPGPAATPPLSGTVADGGGRVGAGGFDVVLGNPPWERIKLQEEEFFAGRDAAIANAANKAARQKLIDVLPKTNPALAADFAQAKRDAEAASKFARHSGRFPLTAVGDVNTYALFAELVRNLIALQGRAGIIVPTGIATDDTTKAFFSDLIETQALAQLTGFENEAFIFVDVHNEFKFCALAMAGIDAQVERADFVFFCRYFEHIKQAQRHFYLSRDDFELLNPNTRTCPVFRTHKDAELTKQIYRRIPILLNEQTGKNAWQIAYLRMLDMANDSNLFVESPSDGCVSLYEAKMIWHFDHRFASLIGEENAGDRPSRKFKGWYGVNPADPHEFIKPRYWVKGKEVEQRLNGKWTRQWLFVFRDVTGVVNERTTVFSIVPRVGVGHTAPLIILPAETSTDLIACMLANFNSLVLDYIVRLKISGSHLSYSMLNQLPVLPPSAYTPADIDFIVPRVLELVYTAYDLRPFAEDLGYHGEPFKWDEERRAHLRAELDAYYARLYGLSRDELRYILDPKDVYGSDFPGETFRVLKEKEEKAYGEFRTRRLLLEKWDRMEE